MKTIRRLSELQGGGASHPGFESRPVPRITLVNAQLFERLRWLKGLPAIPAAFDLRQAIGLPFWQHNFVAGHGRSDGNFTPVLTVGFKNMHRPFPALKPAFVSFARPLSNIVGTNEESAFGKPRSACQFMGNAKYQCSARFLEVRFLGSKTKLKHLPVDGRLPME